MGPVSWNIYIYNSEAGGVHPGKSGDYPKLRRKVIEQRGKRVEKEISMNGYIYKIKIKEINVNTTWS